MEQWTPQQIKDMMASARLQIMAKQDQKVFVTRIKFHNAVLDLDISYSLNALIRAKGEERRQ